MAHSADVDWFGWVVYVHIPDEHGNPCGHPHPAMVLRGPDVEGTLYVIAISTAFDPARLQRFEIEKCQWTVRCNRRDILDYWGQVPLHLAKRAQDLAIAAYEEKQKHRRP